MERVTRRDLRIFGLGVGGILVALGVLATLGLWPFAAVQPRLGPAFAAGGGVLVLLGLLAPRVLGPVHAGWMRIVAPIAWFNTRLLLAVVYYGILLPIGLIRRLGRDPLALRVRGEKSYWVPRDPRPTLESYRRQT